MKRMYFSSDKLNSWAMCHNAEQVKRQWYLYGYAIGRFSIALDRKVVNRLLIEHKYTPYWKSGVEFECCVLPLSFDTCCGKNFKNERGLKRHLKLYH